MFKYLNFFVLHDIKIVIAAVRPQHVQYFLDGLLTKYRSRIWNHKEQNFWFIMILWIQFQLEVDAGRAG